MSEKKISHETPLKHPAVSPKYNMETQQPEDMSEIDKTGSATCTRHQNLG